VFCQLEALRGCFPPALRRVLEELPKTLDTTYERILLSIENARRKYACRLLQCLAVSIRPLRVEERAEVLAIRLDDREDSEYHSDWHPEDARQAVLSACSSLITIVNVNGSPVVQFSHFSVKEFLMSSRLASAGEHLSLYHILPHSAHTLLSRSCLSVLLSLDDEVEKSAVEKRPFVIYAAQYWVGHAKFAGVLSNVHDLIERLFASDGPHFARWVWIYDIDCPWKGFMPTIRPTQPKANRLYYAALCGLRELTDHFITTHQMNIDSRGGDHGTALNAALAKGELDIAQTLLDNGANVNAVDIKGNSSLHRAAEAGHRAVVELLLKYKADVTRAGIEHRTPLHVAAQAAELNICQLLLEHGADVASKTRDGETPLHVACASGQLEIVQCLVRYGAAPDETNNNQATALHLACCIGDFQITRSLIEQGTNMTAKDKDSDITLHCRPHKLVEQFPQVGIDINARNASGQTPLYLASGYGNIEVARYLIKHGADLNCCDEGGGTTLHIAAQYGHLNIVQLLLEHGVGVQVRNKEHATPLMLASSGGHVEVSRVLIEHQADVNSIMDEDWVSLHLASRYGHADVVQLLLDHGADVNIQRVDLLASLHFASANGNLKVAELLIERGAVIDMRNADQETPLDLASRNGELEVARLLIKCGSNIDSQDKQGWAPLHTAAWNGHLSVVELLLDSGADVNMRNSSDKTT
jgi:ankyrin repeat protein